MDLVSTCNLYRVVLVSLGYVQLDGSNCTFGWILRNIFVLDKINRFGNKIEIWLRLVLILVPQVMTQNSKFCSVNHGNSIWNSCKIILLSGAVICMIWCANVTIQETSLLEFPVISLFNALHVGFETGKFLVNFHARSVSMYPTKPYVW